MSKSYYRINVRFNIENEEERAAVEYLKALSQDGSKSRNKFIVDAVIYSMQMKQPVKAFTLDDIQRVMREELQSVSFVSSKEPEPSNESLELSEEEKEQNEQNILLDLAMFG